MPTKIRKGALELLIDSYIRLHNKSRTGQRHITTAINLIDAKLLNGDEQLLLNGSQKSVLTNAVLGHLNTTTRYGNVPILQRVRAMLVSYSTSTHTVMSVTAAFTEGAAGAGTLSATVSSAQSTAFTYLWSRTSGPGSVSITTTTSAAPAVTGLTTGTHVFKVVVTDSYGNTGEDTVDVVVA